MLGAANGKRFLAKFAPTIDAFWERTYNKVGCVVFLAVHKYRLPTSIQTLKWKDQDADGNAQPSTVNADGKSHYF
jgi:hypothetical protein